MSDDARESCAAGAAWGVGLGRVGRPSLRSLRGAAGSAGGCAAGAAGVCASASSTGVRMTTGGMGREPGMLIRIRVVSVVSVFGSPGLPPEAAAPVTASAPEALPYGGVPEG
ncbi:hypothetical protein FHS39_000496 [Streptomyces olivoverticillatus]|uniref:Uncharacterized protein n=1 Tax=Streptomyces olivoverticillatus TaxID=66427 RepID=A0A7W7LKW2_9ACTN|nr:hypothetical protein [Streptomyces olivoverticillatus]